VDNMPFSLKRKDTSSPHRYHEIMPLCSRKRGGHHAESVASLTCFFEWSRRYCLTRSCSLVVDCPA